MRKEDYASSMLRSPEAAYDKAWGLTDLEEQGVGTLRPH